MTDPLRQQLIAQIQRLPADKLPHVETLLTHLECGDSSPLSLPCFLCFFQRTPPQNPKPQEDKDKQSGDESPHSKFGRPFGVREFIPAFPVLKRERYGQEETRQPSADAR